MSNATSETNIVNPRQMFARFECSDSSDWLNIITKQKIQIFVLVVISAILVVYAANLLSFNCLPTKKFCKHTLCIFERTLAFHTKKKRLTIDGLTGLRFSVIT